MINVLDFDHTIYDGDVSLDFYFFVLRRHPLLVRYMPRQLWSVCMYIVGAYSRTEFKQAFFSYLKGVEHVGVEVDAFWSGHESSIRQWFLDRTRKRDVIVSASPEFIIAPIAEKLKVHKLIATRMDDATGVIAGKNCRGIEKVRRLEIEFGKYVVEECFSDSLSDLPILKLAKKGYVVKKDQIKPLEEYHPSRIKQKFFKKSFLTFIIVGGLNALIGLSFALLMSLLVHNKTIAFAIGFCLGLIPSYFLNSTLTFRDYDFKLMKFIKYCISYIPNFLVQTLSVAVFVELLRLGTVAAYIAAVVVGVPVTYAIVSSFAIKDRSQKDESDV